jgi:diacylglycerol kinase family enzyme
MAGVGLDAIVVEEVSPAVKKRLGKVAYWVAGLAMFGRRLPQFRSRFNGHNGTKSFVLASRVRNYGGDLEIARRVSLLDTCFETVAFEGANSLRYLPYFAGVLVGQVGRLAGVTVAPATELHCEPENGHRIPIQLDGELAGHLPASFHIVPEALTLLLPKAYVDRARQRPWITSPTH